MVMHIDILSTYAIDAFKRSDKTQISLRNDFSWLVGARVAVFSFLRIDLFDVYSRPAHICDSEPLPS